MSTEVASITTPIPLRRPGAEAVDLPFWQEAFSGLDWMALHLSPVYAGIGVPRGDGSAVVVVPGFMASDATLWELHAWLGRIGYAAYFSRIGRNMRCPTLHVERLVQTIDRAYEATGRRVTLIGHSLGGSLARAAAQQRPHKVARVVSLGSPVQGGARVNRFVLAAAEYLRGDCDEDCYRPLQDCLPAAVDEVCIYSKADGVVDWRTCQRDGGATNIEVQGTHIGLIWNRQVYRELGALLSLPSAAAPVRAAKRPSPPVRRVGRPRRGRPVPRSAGRAA